MNAAEWFWQCLRWIRPPRHYQPKPPPNGRIGVADETGDGILMSTWTEPGDVLWRDADGRQHSVDAPCSVITTDMAFCCRTVPAATFEMTRTTPRPLRFTRP